MTTDEKLSCTFLRELRKAFFEVFGLHWIFRCHTHEKLRREARDPCIADHFFTHRERIPNLVFTGIVETNDISCESFLSNVTITCLENKGSCNPDFFT